MNAPLYYIYVIRNPEGKLYIGFTSDLDKRLQTHQEDRGGWTRGRGPWKLVYHESYIDRSIAMRRERNLKRGKTNKELRQILEHLNGRACPSLVKD